MSFAAAAGLVVGAGTAIYSGIKQKQEAKKLAASNSYPTQDVPQAEKDNQQLALQQANEGLPSQQYAMAMKNIDRSRTAALRNASDRRAGVGLIGQIQQNTDDAKARLDAANANARIQNTRQLMNVNNKVAGYQQDAFNWNAKNKYNQTYAYSQALQGAGNANLVHGIDEIGSGLISGAARGLFSKSFSPTATGSLSSWNNTGLAGNGAGVPNVAGSVGGPGSPLPLDIQQSPVNYNAYINGY